MKKTTLLLTLLLMLTALTACRETPDDRDLDRQWQLMEIRYADGTTTTPDPRTYYSFYRSVVQISTPGNEELFGIVHYVKKQTLTLEFPDNTAAEAREFYLPVDPSVPDDQKGVTAAYSVVSISSSRMVLSSDAGATYSFRAF